MVRNIELKVLEDVPDVTIFDEAEHEVEHILKNDSFRRFMLLRKTSV